MKKLFIILVLALFQCACATHRPVSMLSFDHLATEITVSYEPLEAEDELSQAVAMSP